MIYYSPETEVYHETLYFENAQAEKTTGLIYHKDDDMLCVYFNMDISIVDVSRVAKRIHLQKFIKRIFSCKKVVL